MESARGEQHSLTHIIQRPISEGSTWKDAPPLAGEGFVTRWGARTTQALAARIATAISGFPPAGLDDKTANNLAAYFLQVSGARAGTQELGTPGTTDVLIREVTATVARRE